MLYKIFCGERLKLKAFLGSLIGSETLMIAICNSQFAAAMFSNSNSRNYLKMGAAMMANT